MWPGDCVFPDYTSEKTRAWWSGLIKDFISNGVDGIWNDMNEPAVFKVRDCINHIFKITLFNFSCVTEGIGLNL